MKICYHGTTDEAHAESILTEGFLVGTYFARHLEDALGFGGPHVFGVVFAAPPEGWQFTCPVQIDKKCIVSYRIYDVRSVFENEELRKTVFDFAMERP